MAGLGDEDLRKKFDTTKMSAEELKMCSMEDGKRGHVGKGVRHAGGIQQAGVSLSRAGRYPVVLAGVAVLTGIGTAMYIKSLNNVEEVPAMVNEALESISISHPHPHTGPHSHPDGAAAPRC